MRRRYFLAAVALLWLPGPTVAAEPPRPITVYAAASLTDVVGELDALFTQSSGIPVKLSIGASSALARQIEAGAPADIFISADQDWMDYLDARSRIRKASRRNLLGNRLALIAPADSTVQLRIEPGFPLLDALHGGRLATGDPDSVPAGRYARGALMSLGVWIDVADRLVRAEDVRTALAWVARGEAPLGIVYETDARVERRVRVVGIFPAGSHLPIVYPMALTPSASADAARFAEFLQGPAARAVFERHGFHVIR